jgi:hypothetical protein
MHGACARSGHRAQTAHGGAVGESSAAAPERSGWWRELERGKVETSGKEEGAVTYRGALVTVTVKMRLSWRHSPAVGVLQ